MDSLDKKTIEILIDKAFDMLNFAYVPYSQYTVGAALLAKNGKIYTGCNIENVSFGGTNCAERTALFKAISEGVKEFKAIAVVGGPQKKITDWCTPCGICRQVLREFCDEDFIFILVKSKTEYKLMTMKEILPESFKPDGEVGATQKL
jgi:cytidine deaminase